MKHLRFSALAIALELSGLTAISTLLIIVPGSTEAQETTKAPEAKEGLTKGIPVPADKDLLEGTWTALHIWTKRNTWKRAGTVQIQKDEATGELLAKWTDNGGGDDPAWDQGNGAIKPKNKVEFSGTDVTLHRKLSAPDGGGENSQTWMGTLYKGTTGNIKIEGYVSGAWIKWEQDNGNGDDFKLIKTGHQTIPLKQGGCSHSILIEATRFNLFGSVETRTRRELFR